MNNSEKTMYRAGHSMGGIARCAAVLHGKKVTHSPCEDKRHHLPELHRAWLWGYDAGLANKPPLF